MGLTKAQQNNHRRLTDRIVQTEGLVSSAPLIANSSLLIDDERRDTKHLQASRDIQPTLPTANDDDGGFDVLEVDLAPCISRAICRGLGVRHAGDLRALESL